jgi:hypothetical protein
MYQESEESYFVIYFMLTIIFYNCLFNEDMFTNIFFIFIMYIKSLFIINNYDNYIYVENVSSKDEKNTIKDNAIDKLDNEEK